MEGNESIKWGITDNQLDVLFFLIDFLRDNHQLPPMAEISRNFGWSSANAANEVLKALQRRGFIEKNVYVLYNSSMCGRRDLDCKNISEVRAYTDRKTKDQQHFGIPSS